MIKTIFSINLKNVLRSLMIGLGIVLVLVALGIVGSKVASKGSNVKIEYTISSADSTTVFSALKSYSEKNKIELAYNYNFPKLGVLVDSIAGIKSGTDGKYWQYYINGNLGDAAADKKEVKAGDKVEWRFEKVPEF